MRTMRWVFLALMIPGALAAQGRGPDRDRRAELEQQIRHRFLASVADRLELTEDQQFRVQQVMEEGAEARRQLADDSRTLRMELMQAVRDDDTPMTRFESILERLENVRVREQEIAEREETALGEFLDARQRAVLLMMRMQFNDRVRQMRGGMMRGEGPPMPPGGGLDGLVPFI